MMENQVKITVVIIAYNDEKHIGRAIESAINQTMREISVICVDDGSVDNTLSIMHSYAVGDSRIHVIALKENGGQFHARYAGIMAAKSKYLMFLDSDDAFELNACEILWREMERGNCDILQFGVRLDIEPGTIPARGAAEWLALYFGNKTPVPKNISKAQLLRFCFTEQKLTWNVWTKISKTELVQKILTHYAGEKIFMCEDMLFSAMSYIFSGNVRKIKNKLYHYSVGGGISTSTDRQEIKNTTDMEIRAGQYQVYSLLLDWLEKENYPVDTISDELKSVKDKVAPNILHTLLHRCVPEKRREYLSHIAEYWPKEDFIDSFIDDVFDSWHAEPTDAISSL